MEFLKLYSNQVLFVMSSVFLTVSVFLVKLIVKEIKKEIKIVVKEIKLGDIKHEALIGALQYQFDNGFKDKYTNDLNQRLREDEFVNRD